MRMTGAQIIVQSLLEAGVDFVSGVPGGAVLPLYDALLASGIRHILVRHEQAAGFVAQGAARSTGRVGVCIATSGPGAMNLLTAIADARSDSVPIIAITGQVNTSLIGTDAFQEADTFGLSFPITKHSIMVKSPAALLDALPKAFEIASSGRPGPVLVDVPRDVQTATCEVTLPILKDLRSDTPCEATHQPQRAPVRFALGADTLRRRIAEVADLMAVAKRPVLFIGGGCNNPQAADGVSSLVKSYPIPVVMTLMALGVLPHGHPCLAGMAGMHGSYRANVAMAESDLVVAAGARFDDRATGVVSGFCPEAKIVHIDVDGAEVNKIMKAAVGIVCDAKEALPLLVKTVANKQELFARKWQAAEARALWREHIQKTPKETTACGSHASPAPDGCKNNPREILSSLPRLAREAGCGEDGLIVTTDVGQHQMWAAQYYPVMKTRSFLTSGSLGTMGFGLPAAIGASLANPTRRVVCISGDGSLMMNVQEMATLAELGLPITIIVFDNGALGMVRQQQKYLLDRRYSASVFSRPPDLVAVARGFGIEAVDADSAPQWHKTALAPAGGPHLVRIAIDAEEDVLPFVTPNRSNIQAIRG